MKKANIFRCIFWGLIMLIVLSLGIIGIIYNVNSFNDNESDLKRIISIFNNNTTIKDYEKVDTKIEATLKGKNIIVEVKSTTDKVYKFNFKRNYLETNIEKDDSIGNIIVMVLADSISVNHGGFEGDTYNSFTNQSVYNYTLDQGIEYNEKNSKYRIKINLENAISKTLDIDNEY